MSIWIARNKDNTLEAYSVKPKRRSKSFDSDIADWVCHLSEDEYPEVTWENSPKELIVKEN